MRQDPNDPNPDTGTGPGPRELLWLVFLILGAFVFAAGFVLGRESAEGKVQQAHRTTEKVLEDLMREVARHHTDEGDDHH